LKKFSDMKRELAIAVGLQKDEWPMSQAFADATIAYFEDDSDTLRKVLTEFQNRVDEDKGPRAYVIAQTYFHLGEADSGFAWLKRSLDSNEGPAPIAIDPDLDGYRTDPRYLELLKRLDLDQVSESQ